MRNRKLPLILLLMLGIGIFSCQKMLTDRLGEDELPVANPALLSEVKKFYQKELRAKMTSGIDKRRNALGATQKASARRQTASVPKTQVYALWKMSKMSTFQGKKDIIEVPILSSRRTVSLIKIARDSLGYVPDRTMVRTIFDRLIISRRKGSETFRSQIVRYHPDRGYLEKHGYDVSHVHLYGLDGFTGYLEYLTVEGERKAVIRVVDGKPVRRSWMGAKGGQKKSPISGRGPVSSGGGMRASGGPNCREECEDIVDEECTSADPDDPDDITCDYVIIDYHCWEECDDDDPNPCADPDFWDSPECEDWHDIPYPLDDCEMIGLLENSRLFQSKFNDLQSKTSESYEAAYTYAPFSGVYDYQQGPDNKLQMTLSITSPIDGYMHSHPTGGLPIFSVWDVAAMYKMYTNGNMIDPNTFTMGVVTAHNTTYMASIDDLALFTTFAGTFLSDSTSIAGVESFYNTAYQGYSFLGMSNIDAHETAFLYTFKDVGIKLFKGDPSTFDAWQRRGINTNNTAATNKNCND